MKFECTEGFSSPIYGDSSFDFSNERGYIYCHEAHTRYGEDRYYVQISNRPLIFIKGPGHDEVDKEMHRFIGFQGFVSCRGKLNHLGFITWALPVETMDDAGRKSFLEIDTEYKEK